jgi:hypothetical protein
MNNWCRALRLIVLLVLFGFGAASAQSWPDYGSCYVICGDQFYEISYLTKEQCCHEHHQCPGEYGSWQGFYWNSYQGMGPEICVN